MTAAPVRRVLVLRFGSFGDLVLTTPALGALRAAWPDAHVTLATRARWVDVARANPHVDEVLALGADEPLWAYAGRLRAAAPDAILDLHQSVRSRALRLLLPRRPTGTWRRRPWLGDLLVRAGLRRFRADGWLADRSHAAVEALVGRPLPRGELAHRVTDAQLATVDALLAAAGLAPGTPMVTLSPGANWATKRWPVEGFVALAARVAAAGLVPVVTGSAAEAGLGAAVAAQVQSTRDLSGRVDLAHLGALCVRSRVVVAHDSGPMHVARALGVPTVAIFGPTDAAQFDFAGHAAVAAPPPCAPCHPYGRASCPQRHFRCMRELPADAVWAEVEPRLGGARVAPVRG